MKLSTRARYGLKALIDLGLHSANEAISLQSIAERQDISTSPSAALYKAGLLKHGHKLFEVACGNILSLRNAL